MRKTRENQRFSVSRKLGKFSGKAQGLSITTIIVAAIALIVLVVIIAIFTGRLGIFSGEIGKAQENKCTDAHGGICLAANKQCTAGKTQAFGKTGCATDVPRCCVLES